MAGLEIARTALNGAQTEVTARERAGDLATKVIDMLRIAADDLVAQEVSAIAPILDRVYARVDPHPSFRTVELVTRTWHGRGRLSTRIADTQASVVSDVPRVVLSSSQMNAMALSVFLALNLGARRPPLEVVLLDDPLQSLDEVNLLGVIDLLRRYKRTRQLIVSTHDRRLAALLQRKLRPVRAGESMAVVRLSDWGRSGPMVQRAEIVTHKSPWRIASIAG